MMLRSSHAQNTAEEGRRDDTDTQSGAESGGSATATSGDSELEPTPVRTSIPSRRDARLDALKKLKFVFVVACLSLQRVPLFLH